MEKKNKTVRQMMNFEVDPIIYARYKKACEVTYTKIKAPLINAMINFAKDTFERGGYDSTK